MLLCFYCVIFPLHPPYSRTKAIVNASSDRYQSLPSSDTWSNVGAPAAVTIVPGRLLPMLLLARGDDNVIDGLIRLADDNTAETVLLT